MIWSKKPSHAAVPLSLEIELNIDQLFFMIKNVKILDLFRRQGIYHCEVDRWRQSLSPVECRSGIKRIIF